MLQTATTVPNYESLVHSLITQSGADRPRYRSISHGLTPDQDLAPTISKQDEEDMYQLLDAVSLGKGSLLFQAQVERVSRGQRLFHYMEKAKQSGEVTPQTAMLAWNTWMRLNGAFSKTLLVPDASYGPDGQFLFLWDRGEHHLELEIEPSGAGYFFYRNRTSGALWDRDYTAGSALAAEILEKLRLFA